MEWPERRRREGRRSVRFTFGRRSSLFCVPVFFLYLCLLWVSVFFGFYVGPAKLQRGATPPSLMVLFSCICLRLLNKCFISAKYGKWGGQPKKSFSYDSSYQYLYFKNVFIDKDIYWIVHIAIDISILNGVKS